MEEAERARRARLGMGLAGLLLLLGFFSLSVSTVGIEVSFLAPWNNMGAGELHFWLAWLLLATPGAFLLAAALGPGLGAPAARAWAELRGLDARGQRWLFGGVFALASVLARLGRLQILRDFPVTDDELSTRLGGQILAAGRASLPLPESWDLFPQLFLYTNTQAGTYSSFDWPGGQAAWALAEWTGLGAWLFALLAGATAALVGATVARRLHPGWGLLASGLCLLSPMMAALSLTGHAHLVARFFVAAALFLLFEARARGGAGWWLASGAALGGGLLTRPPEVLLLCAPLALLLAWQALREEPRLRGRLAWALLGLAPCLLLFLAHNAAVTGDWLFPARFVSVETAAEGHAHFKPAFAFLSDPSLLWQRFGNNTAYNVLMLGLWLAGPLGLGLAVLGAGRDRIAAALAAGVGADLLLTLLHDDYGIHVVGPIHYSEAAVPLVVLAVLGLAHCVRRGRDLGLPVRRWAPPMVAGLALSLVVFDVWHGAALRRQAGVHETVYGAIAELGLGRAVVLAPHYGMVWSAVPEASQVGSLVFGWRPVSPGRSEEIVFLHDMPKGPEGLAALRRDFPGRRFYRMGVSQTPPHFVVVPVSESAAVPEPGGAPRLAGDGRGEEAGG